MAEGEEKTKVERAPLVPSTRLLIGIIGCLGMMMVYATRVNLSVALVCMVNQTAIKGNIPESADASQSNITNEPVLSEQGSLLWSKQIQGALLSAFFYGYVVTQVGGGWMAERIGAKRVLAVAGLGSAICTLLSHLAAELHWIVLLILRVILGLCQGVTFPTVLALWSRWAPPFERGTLVGLTLAGCQVGMVLSLPFSAFLCDYGFGGGWPSIFYVLGAITLVWVLAWQVLAADYPTTHPRISARERNYIVETLADQVDEDVTHGVPKTPWRSIFTSLCVWVCVIGHFAGDWGAYMMLTSLPMFMKDVLQFDMTSLGMIASLPYIAYFIAINVGGIIADAVLARNLLSVINTRRVAMILSLGGQAVFLVLVGYTRQLQDAIGVDATLLAVVFLIVGVGISGFQYAGYVVNYMDIGPEHSGTLFGIGNTAGSVAGMLAPVIMGAMTPNGTVEEWRALFYVTAGVLITGTAVFCIFARGEVQPWATIHPATEMKEVKPEEKQQMLPDTKVVSGQDDDGVTPVVA